MSDAKHTKGPWAWLNGDTLLGNHGTRPVVLTGRNLKQRDPDGLLHDFDPESPDGRLIASAPALLEFAERVLDPKNAGLLMQADLGFGLAAIAQAKGEPATSNANVPHPGHFCAGASSKGSCCARAEDETKGESSEIST